MKTDLAGTDAVSGSAILAALGEPALVVDDEGCIVAANELAAQLANVVPRKLAGLRLHNALLPVAKAIAHHTDPDAAFVVFFGAPQHRSYRVRTSALGRREGGLGARLIVLSECSPEEKLRTLLASLHDLIFVLDDTGRFTEYHKPHRSILYRAPAEFMGRHYTEILPPDVAAQLRDAIVQVRASGEVYQMDYPLTFEDGQTRWYSANISPMLGHQPGLMAFVVAARDITDRKRAEAVEREQRVMAEALREVALALNSTLQLDEIWDHILANVARVAPSDAATIILADGESGYVVRARGYAERGLETPLLAYTFPIHLFGHFRHMLDTHQPCLIPDTWAYANWLLDDQISYPNWLIDQLGHFVRSYLGAPILLDGDVIGFINLESEQSNHFTPADAANLQVFADYAASAIGNARLYAQAQEIATLQERQRLARDLHDAVSQMLFSAKIIVEMLPKLRVRNPDSVWAYLPELHKLVQGAMGEMRTLLLELRPGNLTDVDLDILLRHLADASGGRTAATVALTVAGDAQLPKPVQIALYRIAQEALNNAVKHSRAATITVMLDQSATRVELSVRDDGIGFDKTQLRPEQLGLSIMHERAQEIDAEFAIQSTPGAGAEVRVRWRPPTTRG